MINIDKVYVLHVKEGYEDRAESISRQLNNLDIAFEYILDGDICDLTDEIINRYFNDQMPRDPAGLSCTLKHILAHEKTIDDNAENALILEDDVVLANDFSDIFNKCIEEAGTIEQDSCIYYGNGCNLYVPAKDIQPGKYLYKAEKSRAADSYSISRRTAAKRVDFFKENKCSYISDHMFTYMDEILDIQTYWSHPTIVEQGSMNGLFESSLHAKRHNGLLRTIKWRLEKLYKQKLRRRMK